MENINDVITKAAAEAVAKLSSEGKLAELVELSISKAVASKVEELFSWRSDFTKALEASLKAGLQVDLGELQLTGYNQIVLQILQAQVKRHLTTAGAEKLEANMKRLLEGETPAQITLAELVQQFHDAARDERRSYLAREREQRPTVLLEKSEWSAGDWYLYLDPAGGKSKYDCKYRLGIRKNGEVWSMQIEHFDSRKSIFANQIYGFGRSLFQMHAAGTLLIIADSDLNHVANLDWTDDEHECVRD